MNDVAHANIRGETEEFLERLGKRIVHVHVSDNRADQDTHLQIGSGTVNWAETMKTFKKIGFEGTVIAVSHDRTFLARFDRYIMINDDGGVWALPDFDVALQGLSAPATLASIRLAKPLVAI